MIIHEFYTHTLSDSFLPLSVDPVARRGLCLLGLEEGAGVAVDVLSSADTYNMDHMAEWLMLWTQDQEVWVSIPASPVMGKRPWASFQSTSPLSIQQEWVPRGRKSGTV